MAERKVFNIVKRIPVLGNTYGLVRGAVYELAGDRDEAKNSMEMDFADLNPLRMPRNLMNGLIDLTSNVDKGIWIGKRTLGGNQPFGLTFSPGADVHHWCIQIDGIIYELGGSKSQVSISIISKDNDPTTYVSYCKRFSWTMLTGRSSSVSESRLRDFAKSFEQYRYQAVLPIGDTVNCQTFVKYMYAKAAGISNAKAAGDILAIIPNLIF
ncbi:hypothetical protein I4U23_015934 [Adineta vaga]|nr:hypothetical protein I4U23_015934 [Adineta vaga]